MGNHAALIRQENSGLPVSRRGRRFIEFDLGGGRKRFVTTIDPLHYGSGNAEIDATWRAESGTGWDWGITANSFHLHARSVLNAGDIIQWYDADTGENVILQPLALNWVNNANDSRQQIAQPGAVTAQADDAVLYWPNGYGTGRHFRYTAHPQRLIKHLIIDSAANLPTPTVANPYLEIEFILKATAGVTLYCDGVAWDRTTKINTARATEFRTASGEVVWQFDAPGAIDAAGNTVAGIFQLRRQGANRYCTVRIPKTWIDNAVFPIVLDPTFTDGYGGDETTSFDTYTTQNVPDADRSTENVIADRASASACRIALIKFASLTGVTVNSTTLYLYAGPNNRNDADHTIHRILAANSGWLESCTWNYADGAGASDRWAGDTDNNGGSNAGCSVSGTDWAAANVGSFSTQAAHALGQEYAVSLDADEIQTMFEANYGLAIVSAANVVQEFCSSDHATSGYRPKLVVEYTEGGGGSVPVFMHHMQQQGMS